MTKRVNKVSISLGLLGAILSTNVFALSEQQAIANQETYFSNTLFNVLLGAIIFLIIVIAVLANSVKNSAYYYKDRNKDSSAKKVLTILILFLAISSDIDAQEAILKNNADKSYWGLDSAIFYIMVGVIVFEVSIIYFLINLLYDFLEIKKQKNSKESVKESTFLEKINASVAIEQEEEIMFEHEYDGIRELDNNLPPWWVYGFYLTIGFAIIYLAHYHVTKTGDLQLKEYKKELVQADLKMQEFRKKSANLVDETNVKMLSDAENIAKGKDLFINNCAACHGNFGEGKVGPNLTDPNWIHGGSINDIFKTIKFGYPEKGMKAWKEDFSPSQINQISSFIKTLNGTNPPNAKAPEGEIYTETIAASDSIYYNKKDSLIASEKTDTIKLNNKPIK